MKRSRANTKGGGYFTDLNMGPTIAIMLVIVLTLMLLALFMP